VDLFNIFRRKVKNEHNFVGAPSFQFVNPAYYKHYSSEEYASAYPNIRAIVDEYMTVLPKAIDSNGKDQLNNPILNALYHPNQADGVVSFNEKIGVSTLVNKKTYILVWRNENGQAVPGGDFGFRGKNISGFTFLENPAINRRDNKTFYNIGAQEFTENEVMVLPGGVDGHSLYEGYSPTEAAVRWITLDDYIADFQKGFFENNAIPAGTFVVTAPTIKEYNQIVDMMQSRHRGAGKNNNVTYSHRPVDPNTGKPAEAQIEWIPYAQSNKDIDFKSLFEQTNSRIDMAYGVSRFIKGVDDAPNYATANVSERNFAKRAVLPLLTRNYNQLTHELNRITGGIGVAITFQYDIPEVADENEVNARTALLHSNLITTLSTQGYTMGSIVDAFDLPKRIKKLSKSDESTEIENDKPEVDEGNEVETSPDPDKIDGITPTNKRLYPKSQLTDANTEMYEDILAIRVRAFMQKQIDEAVLAVDAADITNVDVEDFTDEMLQTIVATMIASGDLEYQAGISLLVEAGVSLEGITAFALSESEKQAYRDYLLNVASSFRDDTAASIREVLLRGNEQGLTKNELQVALRNIMNTDEYRVTRLAVSEINRSQQMGSLHAMQQIENEVDTKIYKIWNVSNSEKCEFCQAMDGRRVPLNEAFIEKGGIIVGKDGGVFVNDFVAMDTPQAHPNCMCYFTWEVEK
jgi:phage portal protein BeeE